LGKTLASEAVASAGP